MKGEENPLSQLVKKAAFDPVGLGCIIAVPLSGPQQGEGSHFQYGGVGSGTGTYRDQPLICSR